MGVQISLHASNMVDPAQWEKAYEESLILVDKFNFIEFQKFNKFEGEYTAAVKSKERECPAGIGWITVGEGHYLMTAEDFFMPRKIANPKENENYCDPLMYIYAQNGSIDFDNPYVNGLRSFWGGKTQGAPYHVGLLAIGCLLDDRLNGEVLCSDDITYGQCKHAVEVANKILKKKIGMPLRCRMEDLYKRVRKLPIKKEQMLEAFAATYLGIKDEQYYKFVEEHFSEEEQNFFIKKRMCNRYLGTVGFVDCLQEVLSYNIPIASACSAFLEMPPEKKILENGENPFKKFVENILDTNIYLKEKDLRDCLNVDETSGETMSVEKLMAGFLFYNAHNHSVARYVPLEDLKEQLVESIGDKCDVGGIIDEYLNEKDKKQNTGEKDARTNLNDWHDRMDKLIAERRKKYDICDSEHFVFYEKGNSFVPGILDSLKTGMKFFKDVLEEPQFKELSEGEYEKKCHFLVSYCRLLKLMNYTWMRIFEDVKNNPENFKRYYPMARIVVNSDVIHDFLRAYVENDDFYELCQGL